MDTETENINLWQTLLSGNLQKALAGFQTMMQAAPASKEGWIGTLACFCAAGQISTAYEILRNREEQSGDSAVIFLNMLMGFTSTKQDKLLSFLEANWAQDRSDYCLILYHVGHYNLSIGQSAIATHYFMRCKPLYLQHATALKVKTDSDLYSNFRQVVNLITDEEITTLQSLETGDYFAELVGDIEWLDTSIHQASAMGFAAADRYYAESFGPDFLSSLATHWPKGSPFHLHIVDVGEEDREALFSILREKAGSLDLRISLSDRPTGLNLQRSAYYASIRFFMMSKLLNHYKTAITTFDIDMIAKSDLSPILNKISRFDYARYMRPDYGPGGHDYAALTSYQGVNGKRFSDLVARIIRERMNETGDDHWFIDQTALYQASQTLSNQISQGDFKEELEPLDTYFNHLSAQEIKLALARKK